MGANSIHQMIVLSGAIHEFISGCLYALIAAALYIWSYHPRRPHKKVLRPIRLGALALSFLSVVSLAAALAEAGRYQIAQVVTQLAIPVFAIPVVYWVAVIVREFLAGPWTTLLQQTNEELKEARNDLEAKVELRTAQLQASKSLFDEALEGSSVCLFKQDANLRYSWLTNPNIFRTRNIVGRTDYQLAEASDVKEVRESFEALIAAKTDVLKTGIPQRVQIEFASPHREVWLDILLHRVAEPDGSFCLTGVSSEITQLKEQEHRLETKSTEYRHRLKNVLGNVIAIIGETGRSMGVDPNFRKVVHERVSALTAAIDLGEVEIGALVNRQLGHLVQAYGGRLRAIGDATLLTETQAEFVSLALHQLGTNARKYGALSNDAGTVTLTWVRRNDALEITWSERDGPQPNAGAGTGFGRKLLERLVPKGVGGTSSYELLPTGLCWSLRFPVEQPMQPPLQQTA